MVTPVVAQAPQRFQFQAVARDPATGIELANQSVLCVMAIRAGSANGEIVYQETHANLATNAYGLFSVQVGGGSPDGGSLTAINWNNGPYFLSVSLDLGSGLNEVSTTQLLSVPYALHANTATTALSAQTADNVDDADADPENELITSVELNAGTLTIAEGADNIQTVNLSDLINDADADPGNELITNLQLEGTTLALTEGPNNLSVELGSLVNDADSDPSNELISDVQLDGTILTIQEASTSHEVDLEPILLDDDWVITPDAVYNEEQNVGVGTDSPEARLHLRGGSGNTPNRTLLVESALGANLMEVRNNGQVSVNNGNLGSSFSFGGSMSVPVAEISSSITLNDSHYLIVTTGNASVTVTLPNAATCPGRVYHILRRSTSAVQVTPSAGNTLEDSNLPLTLVPFGNPSVSVVSGGGTNWYILSYQ